MHAAPSVFNQQGNTHRYCPATSATTPPPNQHDTHKASNNFATTGSLTFSSVFLGDQETLCIQNVSCMRLAALPLCPCAVWCPCTVRPTSVLLQLPHGRTSIPCRVPRSTGGFAYLNNHPGLPSACVITRPCQTYIQLSCARGFGVVTACLAPPAALLDCQPDRHAVKPVPVAQPASLEAITRPGPVAMQPVHPMHIQLPHPAAVLATNACLDPAQQHTSGFAGRCEYGCRASRQFCQPYTTRWKQGSPPHIASYRSAASTHTPSKAVAQLQAPINCLPAG